MSSMFLSSSASFLHILYFLVLPVLLLAAAGYVIQKTLTLDMPTLARLNLHLVVPALIFFSVVNARITGAQVATVVLFSLCLMAAMSALALGSGKLFGVPRDMRSALLLTAVFFNAGNFGLPLQDLAFRAFGLSEEAMAIQAFIVIVQNVATFTLGVFVAAAGRRESHWRGNLLAMAKFPPIYALLLGLAALQARRWLGAAAPDVAHALDPFWQAVVYAKNALIAVALVTLGAQLALVKFRGGARRPVVLGVMLRLLAGPAAALALIYLFGIHGFLAQVLLIGSAAPTAVNALLLCLQFENHPEIVAKTVFFTTVLSPLTVTLVILLAQGGWLTRFAM